jgi:hypothetical protein
MDAQLEHIGLLVRSCSMPKPRTHRYSIEIKDAKGQSVLFTVADWNKYDLRLALARILRLDGVTEPLLSSESVSPPGKE